MTDKRTVEDLINEICCNLGFMPTDNRLNNLRRALDVIESKNREADNTKAFIKGIANNCINFLEI